jgi:hypothetical protein
LQRGISCVKGLGVRNKNGLRDRERTNGFGKERFGRKRGGEWYEFQNIARRRIIMENWRFRKKENRSIMIQSANRRITNYGTPYPPPSLLCLCEGNSCLSTSEQGM